MIMLRVTVLIIEPLYHPIGSIATMNLPPSNTLIQNNRDSGQTYARSIHIKTPIPQSGSDIDRYLRLPEHLGFID